LVRIFLLAVAATLLIASPAAAAPTWLAPQNFEVGLADPQPFSGRGDVAVTPSGKAVAVWIARVAGVDRAHARVRFPGQGFGPRITFTPANGSNAANIHVASDAQGNVTATWDEQQGPGGIQAIRAARLPAGSATFEPIQTVSNSAVKSTSPAIGVGASGVAVIVYDEDVAGVNEKLRAAIRNGPGGPFVLSAGDVSLDRPAANFQQVVGVDDDGDTVVAWVRPTGGATRTVEANFRPRNGSFGAPLASVVQLSNPGLAADDPVLAMAPNGTTVVLWSQLNPQNDIRYSERTPGNQWLPDPRIASQPGTTAIQPVVAMDGAGNAVAAWSASRGAGSFLQAALRPTGGAFGGVYRDLTTISGFQLDIASNRAGDSIITYSDGMGDFVGSVRRPRGGEFSGVIPAERQATDSTQMINGAVGIDDQGNAAGLWFRHTVNPGNTHAVATGAFDAAPPTLNASVPANGQAGTAVQMAAAAADRLTSTRLTWAFGDGGTATGGAVSHAFGAAGAFTVRVTATDGVGNATTAARQILVAAAPPPPKKRIRVRVRVTWALQGKKIALVKMVAPRVPKGTKAQVTCKGKKKCPFKRKASSKRRKGKIVLFKEVSPVKALASKKRNFRGGQRVQLRLTKRGFIGQVVRYKLKTGRLPVGRNLCLPVGATKPRARC
jgi:hypothetical protein